MEIKNFIPENLKFDGIIITVAHDQFKRLSVDYWKNIMNENCLVLDIKGVLPKEINAIRI